MARPPRPHTGAGHRRAFGSRARGKTWLRGGANARPALGCAGAHVSICSEGTDCNERCSVSHGSLAGCWSPRCRQASFGPVTAHRVGPAKLCDGDASLSRDASPGKFIKISKGAELDLLSPPREVAEL